MPDARINKRTTNRILFICRIFLFKNMKNVSGDHHRIAVGIKT